MEATWWLNEQLEAWLGEKNAADTLTQSVPDNVTSEMGLALLDVADVDPPAPGGGGVPGAASRTTASWTSWPSSPGGREARDAIRAFLDTYGMRCVGEIDITRPRWSERPTTLVPLILGNVKNFEPGAGERRFEQGRQEAWAKEQEVLERLRALPDGEAKAEETKRMIDRVRTFIGYREYPKYGMVSRYFVYKQALLEEAERLVQAGVLREPEDIFFLTFQELHDVVRTHRVDDQLIARRKDAFRSYQALTPPRVLTSDGEVVAGAYRRDDVPAGALVGLAGLRRDGRGAGPRHPRHGGGRARAGRHPRHRLHRPELVAAVRRDRGPGDRGRRPDDPRRGDRPGVRPAGRRRGGARHPADPGRAADPRARHRRLRRAPVLGADTHRMALFAGPVVIEWYWIPIAIGVTFVLPALTVAVIAEIILRARRSPPRTWARRRRMWGIVAVTLVALSLVFDVAVPQLQQAREARATARAFDFAPHEPRPLPLLFSVLAVSGTRSPPRLERHFSIGASGATASEQRAVGRFVAQDGRCALAGFSQPRFSCRERRTPGGIPRCSSPRFPVSSPAARRSPCSTDPSCG